jgi:hypothetical protein
MKDLNLVKAESTSFTEYRKNPLRNLMDFFKIFACLMPGLLFSQTAYNPNILPLGDKESLMANTGTGGLNSTGSVYYNPGALTQVEGNSLSLSGSAYMQFRFEATPVFTFEGTDLDYSGKGYQTIPTSLIVVRTYKDWYLAYSILIPMSFSFEGPSTWVIPVNDQQVKMKMLQNYDESIFMAGVTAARKLGNGWSAGVSFYGQAYSYLSSIDLRGGIIENPDLIVQSSSRNTLYPVNLLIIGGIHKNWEKWGFGLRAEAPNIYLFGTGNYYDYWYNNFGGQDNIVVSETDLENIKGKFRTPLDLRMGTVFRPSGKLTLALDFAYRFGLEYDIYEEPGIESHESLKGNYRINGGLEYFWRENFALYGGGSYTPTTLKETETRYGQDFWAVFAGGKMFSRYFETSAGLFYSLGKGEGTLAAGAGKSTQLYEYVGFVLGTNYKF